jgi:phosphinothricin acetyltransferase
VTLRKAEDKDLARVVEIYNSSIESRLSTADTSPVTVESKQDWFTLRPDTRPLLVYEKLEKIVGWASIEKFNDRPAYRNTAELSVYIDQFHLGAGIGTVILSEVVALLPTLGIKNAIAKIYSHNAASLNLFGKFDFKLWGELPEVCEMDGQAYSVSILGLKVHPTG